MTGMRDRPSLDGRVALVTGAGSQVGRAIALDLAREGATVAVNTRDPGAGAEVVREIERIGGRAFAVAADVDSRDEVSRLARTVREELSDITVLVHNATPRRHFVPFDELDDDDWSSFGHTILAGGMYAVQAVLPDMRAARFGRIVFMSGITSVPVLPLEGFVHVAAIKSAVEGMGRALAVALGRDGIVVNVVSPGPVEDPGESPSESLSSMLAASTTGRCSTASEIASACRFLCSGAAGNVTGQVLHCNGGLYFGR